MLNHCKLYGIVENDQKPTVMTIAVCAGIRTVTLVSSLVVGDQGRVMFRCLDA